MNDILFNVEIVIEAKDLKGNTKFFSECKRRRQIEMTNDEIETLAKMYIDRFFNSSKGNKNGK